MTVAISVGVIVVLIFFSRLGFAFATRHTYPLFGLTLLALLVVIRITPAGTRLFANFLLAVWGGVIVGSVVCAGGTSRRVQEPTGGGRCAAAGMGAALQLRPP